jgi:hypothetical protein
VSLNPFFTYHMFRLRCARGIAIAIAIREVLLDLLVLQTYSPYQSLGADYASEEFFLYFKS